MRALLRELSPVQEADGRKTPQTRHDWLSQRGLQHALEAQRKDPLMEGFLEEVATELTRKPSACAGQKLRQQTVEEGACARQVANRSWSSGNISQLSVTRMGFRWKSATEDMGEIAAVQAQRQVQSGHNWVCVEKEQRAMKVESELVHTCRTPARCFARVSTVDPHSQPVS